MHAMIRRNADAPPAPSKYESRLRRRFCQRCCSMIGIDGAYAYPMVFPSPCIDLLCSKCGGKRPRRRSAIPLSEQTATLGSLRRLNGLRMASNASEALYSSLEG